MYSLCYKSLHRSACADSPEGRLPNRLPVPEAAHSTARTAGHGKCTAGGSAISSSFFDLR